MVCEALRLLEERDQSLALWREVREGFAQIERGEYTEYDEHTIKDLAADIKDRGMKGLAGKRKRNRIEALLLEGLNSEASEMTESDWAQLKSLSDFKYAGALRGCD